MAAENNYPLQYPITFNDKKIENLSFRRLKVRDRRRIWQMHKDEADAEIQAIADACEVPFECIEELDGTDFDALQKRMSEPKKQIKKPG